MSVSRKSQAIRELVKEDIITSSDETRKLVGYLRYMKELLQNEYNKTGPAKRIGEAIKLIQSEVGGYKS